MAVKRRHIFIICVSHAAIVLAVLRLNVISLLPYEQSVELIFCRLHLFVMLCE